MANNYYDSEEFRKILKSYEESEKTGENRFFDSNDLLDIADYYCLHGKVPEARVIVDNALETFPDSDDALLMKARMLLTYDHDPDKAESVAEMVNDKQDVDYIYIMVEIMLTRGKREEAEQWLEKVYGSDEEEPEEVAEEIAKIYADYNDMKMAKKWLDRSGDDDSSSKKELRVRILISNGEIEESQAILNELIDEDPYNTLYWNLLATTQYLSNNIEDAITSCEYSLAINPNDEEALLNKANGLYQLGNYEDAIKYYKQFMKLRPDEDSGDMMIGISMIAQDRIQEGVEYLKKAEKKITIDSTHNNEIYQELTLALCKLNLFDEALAYIKKSDKKKCDHNDMMVLKGYVLMMKGDFDAGQVCFKKALKNSGFSPYIYLKIGIALYENHLYISAYMTTKSLIDTLTHNSLISSTPGDKQIQEKNVTTIEDMPEVYAYHALFSLYVNHEDEYEEYKKLAYEKDPNVADVVLGGLNNNQ